MNGRFYLSLRKAEQLGLFGPAPTSSTTVRVATHVRNRGGKLEVVEGHDRHLKPHAHVVPPSPAPVAPTPTPTPTPTTTAAPAAPPPVVPRYDVRSTHSSDGTVTSIHRTDDLGEAKRMFGHGSHVVDTHDNDKIVHVAPEPEPSAASKRHRTIAAKKVADAVDKAAGAAGAKTRAEAHEVLQDASDYVHRHRVHLAHPDIHHEDLKQARAVLAERDQFASTMWDSPEGKQFRHEIDRARSGATRSPHQIELDHAEAKRRFGQEEDSKNRHLAATVAVDAQLANPTVTGQTAAHAAIDHANRAAFKPERRADLLAMRQKLQPFADELETTKKFHEGAHYEHYNLGRERQSALHRAAGDAHHRALGIVAASGHKSAEYAAANVEAREKSAAAEADHEKRMTEARAFAPPSSPTAEHTPATLRAKAQIMAVPEPVKAELHDLAGQFERFGTSPAKQRLARQTVKLADQALHEDVVPASPAAGAGAEERIGHHRQMQSWHQMGAQLHEGTPMASLHTSAATEHATASKKYESAGLGGISRTATIKAFDASRRTGVTARHLKRPE